jgi:hypothetical protein
MMKILQRFRFSFQMFRLGWREADMGRIAGIPKVDRWNNRWTDQRRTRKPMAGA